MTEKEQKESQSGKTDLLHCYAKKRNNTQMFLISVAELFPFFNIFIVEENMEGNIVLRIICQSNKLYISFSDIYEKASWLINKKELYQELSHLVGCGYIRIKGIKAELHIRITGAGIRFLAECA